MPFGLYTICWINDKKFKRNFCHICSWMAIKGREGIAPMQSFGGDAPQLFRCFNYPKGVVIFWPNVQKSSLVFVRPTNNL